ncbi:hypothetical protein ONZ45_g4496 [Pleurotus djamor]|nr:hypothetical protein ONZ45_g4496 [Pleurotus djamor]
MIFRPFEVTIPHVAYACLGGFVVIFGMFSLLLREKLYIGEACWAFLFGVIIGPYGAGIFDPRHWGGSTEVTNMITLEFTRVVLAIGVFAIGVELPKAYMARHWKSMFFLLVPVMTWGWFVSAGLIYALVPGLTFLSSLAVAACLTPTDPILAAAVVGGKYADKHVPAHIRHMLAAESGCNDGAAFPFLYISLYLIMDSPHTGQAIRDWFLILWLYNIIMAVVIGGLLGFGFRHLMKFCERRNLIDRHSYVAQYISLALLTIGVCTLLGTDDLLAAFACGTAFAWDGFFNRQTEESVFSSVIDLLFNIAAFVFVGAWMPFSSFQDAELTLTVWRLVVIAILILLLRRLPIMIAMYKWIPDVKTFREALFSGHFGPIGIGAVFISTLAAEILHGSHSEKEQTVLVANAIQPITAFMVLTSITIHGLHAPPDWTNQARHVDRAEDVVINRDSEMERGELVPPRRDTDSTDVSITIAEKRRESEGSSDETKRDTEGKLEMSESQKEENLPDGDEVISEWQEGPHVVIERRSGPGEEVEVEVIRNVNHAEPTPPKPSLLRGPQDEVHRYLGPFIQKLSHAPHAVEQSTEEVAENIAEDARQAEMTVKNAAEAVLHHDNDHDDDEGWTSDRSNGNASTSAITQQPSTSSDRKRKKAFTKHTPKLGSVAPVRRSRTRGSARKGHHSMSNVFVTPPSPGSPHSAILEISRGGGRDSPSDSNSTRGRTQNPRADSTHNSRSGSLRHHRLDRVMALHASREASPARSVRFFDEEPRISTSPSYSTLKNTAGAKDTSNAPKDDSDDSPNKVTFDLPDKA